jgi:hypothetical protein
LPRHGPQSSQQEVFPLLKVHDILFTFPLRTQFVLCIVLSSDIVHDSPGLPTYNTSVRVLESRYTTVFIDFEELGSLEAILGIVTKLPQLNLVGELELFERNGEFDWGL